MPPSNDALCSGLPVHSASPRPRDSSRRACSTASRASRRAGPLERIGRASPTQEGSRVPRLTLHVQSRRGEVTEQITTIGLDLAKHGSAFVGRTPERRSSNARCDVNRCLRGLQRGRPAWLAWRRVQAHTGSLASYEHGDHASMPSRPQDHMHLAQENAMRHLRLIRGRMMGGKETFEKTVDARQRRDAAWALG